MKELNPVNKKTLRLGGYSVIVMAVVVVIVILINLALNMLPSRFTKYSTSPVGLYEISDVSREIMGRVEDEITVNIVAESDYVDSLIREYVVRYTDLNPKVGYALVDPALRPGFISEYTDEALTSTQTHLILVNRTNGRSRVVTYEELMPVQYSQEELLNYYYYGIPPTGTRYFNAEQCLTSAIDYLTMEKLPVLYYVKGHGEAELAEQVTKLIADENIELKELTLLSEEKVPSDASAVLIHAAAKDLTEEEAKALTDYIAEGGNVIMTSFYNSNLKDRKLKNLYGVAEAMGLLYDDRYVLEGSAGHYYNNPSYILPTIVSNDFSASLPPNTNMVMFNCHGINLASEKPSGVTLSELLTTTVKGYSKSEIKEDTTISKEEGDEEGKYVIGAMSVKKNDNGSEGKLLWFASPAILDGSTVGSFSNISYFLSMLSDICEKEASVTIDAKSLQIEALSVSEESANLWGIILIGLIPVAVLGFGFILWTRRIRR